MKLSSTSRKDDEITMSVLGHSTVLINFYGKWIITDPVLFDKIWVQIGKWKIGMKRISPLAIDLDDLPKIDMILLSHTHMDHFDIQSIKHLIHKNIWDIKIICPHNAKRLLQNIPGISEIYELDRDHEIKIWDISIKSWETNHRWARRPWDKKKHTRWSKSSMSYNAYMISWWDRHIFFWWDTAYTDIYKDTWYQADVAIMPIWAYDPWLSNHCNPEQALDMALDLWAKYFIPIHCETFRLGREEVDIPRRLLSEAIQHRDDISLWSSRIWDIFTIR